jgi:RHS repeat-associated protein
MYYQYNGRHTVSELTDRHGSMIESYRYDAFGSMYSGIAAPYNTASYTGHHFDNMTGLMDMKARWYDSSSARFLTEDTWAGSLTQPYTQNRYAYVGNNPVNMWDPSGNVPEWVRSQSDYTVSETRIDLYYETEDRYANVGDWKYTRITKQWYEFNSYSSDWGSVQHTNRVNSERFYTDYYLQVYSEKWNYTYYDRVFEDVHALHTWDRITSNSVEYSENTDYEWSETVTASEVAAAHETAKAGFGLPPAHASKKTTFSVDGVEFIQISSMDGVTVSAEVLVTENQYKNIGNAKQQILFDVVGSFFGGDPSRTKRSTKGEVQIASFGFDIGDWLYDRADEFTFGALKRYVEVANENPYSLEQFIYAVDLGLNFTPAKNAKSGTEVLEQTGRTIGNKITKEVAEDAAAKVPVNLLNKHPNYGNLAKNASPNDLIKNLENQGWTKVVQQGGSKSGPATIFTDPNTGMKIRIHAAPGQGNPYFRVQNNGGNYLGADGNFPSNATKQEFGNLTHFEFGK